VTRRQLGQSSGPVPQKALPLETTAEASMNTRAWMVCIAFALTIVSCRTMELANKTIELNKGDDRAKVLQIMGTPQDRQFLGDYEVLQYCITGAGFGYHDYSAIWLRSGKVVGITTYKDHTPASSCRGHFRSFQVKDAPDSNV